VQEVDPLAVDFGGVLRELVELRLELAPVVAGSPVLGAEVSDRNRSGNV
jgi:hypothetical protein